MGDSALAVMTDNDQRLTERLRLLEEARAIEQAGGDWRVKHVAAVLDVAPSTVYQIVFLRQRMIKVAGGRTKVRPADVRLYESIRTNAKR